MDDTSKKEVNVNDFAGKNSVDSCADVINLLLDCCFCVEINYGTRSTHKRVQYSKCKYSKFKFRCCIILLRNNREI